jgi:hypothetical protein
MKWFVSYNAIADWTHRRDLRGDWDNFDLRLEQDEPITDILSVVGSLKPECDVHLFTFQSYRVRDLLQRWLFKHRIDKFFDGVIHIPPHLPPGGPLEYFTHGFTIDELTMNSIFLIPHHEARYFMGCTMLEANTNKGYYHGHQAPSSAEDALSADPEGPRREGEQGASD